MNKYISDFLNSVCGEIKYTGAHQNISEELQGHIYEIMEDYIESGMDEEKAVQKAIEQMGDPLNIGKELNKTHRPKTEWSIISLVSAMVLIGGITLFSIARDTTSMISFKEFFKSYLVYTFIGIGAFGACFFFDYTKLEKYSLHIFLGTIIFLLGRTGYGYDLFYGVNWGIAAYGPHITIGRFVLSTGPITVPLFMISFSGLANKWATGNIKDTLKLFGLAALAIFVFSITHASYAVVMLLIAGFIIIITRAILSKGFKGNKKRYLFSIYGGGTIAIFMLLLWVKDAIGTSYRASRLFIFLNPQLDPQGAGYINLLLKELLASAKLFGKNDHLYLKHQGVIRMALPEANTDFVFTYIVSAFGWIVGIITIMVIALAVNRMFLATKKINHQYGRYLASSIVVVFSLQAAANILMNIGMLPITSFSLPFISYGGTNFVINMALMGLLLGVYRRKDLVAIMEKCPKGTDI